MLLFGELQLWVYLILIMSVSWRILMHKRSITKVNRWLLLFLTISGCVVIAVTAREQGLLLSMIHLLCFAYALKLVELKTRKDFFQQTLIGLFLLASSLIFVQSLMFFIIFSLVFIINLATLKSYFTPSSTLINSSTQSLKHVLLSIPLAIALFFLFPKLSPFWEVPFAQSAKTGLSDNVTVGDIANLALSNELAFRVEFEDQVPIFNQMYWRAVVMDQFDGQSWKKRQRLDRLPQARSFQHDINPDDSSVKYRVFAKPSYQKWLFGLDIATTQNKNILQKADFTLYSQNVVAQSMSYDVTSYIEAPLNITISENQMRQNLLLPVNSNPRLLAYAQTLRKEFQDNEQLIQSVLNQFNTQPFQYTLQPPTLTGHTLDKFFFDTKAGFCGHYASTFAFLMRAVGIPARLVTGYMGAEYNANGNFYAVKQRDAHAWAEVWIAGQGWLRIDPTAYVHPERVENGFSDALLEEQSTLSGEFWGGKLGQLAWMNWLKLQLDNLDYQWTKWVVGFNAERQLNILEELFGDSKVWKVVIALLSILGLTLGFIVLLNLRSLNKEKLEPCLEMYLKLIEFMNKKGIERPLDMGALEFSRYIVKHNPSIAKSFCAFSTSFLALQYQSLTVEQKLDYQSRIVKQFNDCKREISKI